MIRTFFDYIYYRIAKFFFKDDGSDAVRALMIITLMKFLLLLSLFFAVQDSFFDIPRRDNISIYEKVIAVGIMFIIFMLNRKRYNGKYLEFREKWINESPSLKIRNGVLVILFILFPLFLVVLIAHIFGRTNF